MNAIFRHEANHFLRSERGTTTATLSAAGQLGLRTYLEGPVRSQLQKELGGVPGDVSFVFGHTHKPFADTWPIIGFPSPVPDLQHRRVGRRHGGAGAGAGGSRRARRRRPRRGAVADLPQSSGPSSDPVQLLPIKKGRRASV